MSRPTTSNIVLLAVAVGCVWLLEGCTHPLGPGFRFAARQTEIRAVSDEPAKIHIRIIDRLENIGDRSLRELDVRMPSESAVPSQNLRVFIRGRQIVPARASTDERLLRTPFDPAWDQLQSREIVTELEVPGRPGSRGTVAASAAAFHIADGTVLPLWQAPRGIFVKGGSNPVKQTLTVFTPSDFRVIAPGKPLRQRTEGNMVVRPFVLEPSNSFLPFVVAGRYQEKIAQASQQPVAFWTFQQLDDSQAQMAGMRIAASMSAFTEFFGPISSPAKSPIRIVEGPTELPEEFGGFGGASFPGGAILGSKAFTQGIASEPVLQLIEYELVRTWFGWRVRLSPEVEILMGRGIGLFGLVVSAEARGQDERRRVITFLMNQYDEARRVAADQPLLEPPSGYSRAERISTGYKAALFYVAIEDLCGRDALRAGLKQIVHVLGGTEVAAEELRSALENTSHRNLAETFRTWIKTPGIPGDFRASYGLPSGTRKALKIRRIA